MGIFIFLVFSFAYAFALWRVLSPYLVILHDQRRYGGGQSLQFTLADCWGLAIGLSPSAFLAAQVIAEHRGHGDALSSATMVLFVLIHQLAGAVVMLATEASPSRRVLRRNSFWPPLLGALFGLLLPLMLPFLLMSRHEPWAAPHRPAPARRKPPTPPK